MTDAGNALSVRLNGQLGAFALDCAFDVPMRGITGLYGPSGSGKTTVLRCIAGLARLDGRIAAGGDLWQDSETSQFVPAHLRHIGYVFQEASLFAHLSVRDNLTFGARRTGTEARGGMHFDDIVDLLGLAPLLDRATPALSGGERQRVAVGRALLAQPRVLLMDEPLAALDERAKREILPVFETLHAHLTLPIIYVSHDLAELERLADTLVLLDRGCITATGPLRALQTDPALPLLSAPGAAVVLEGHVIRIDDAFGLTTLQVNGAELIVSGRHGTQGDRRRVRISATDVTLALSPAHDSSVLNCLPSRVVAVHEQSEASHVDIVIALGDDGQGDRVSARISRKSCISLAITPGLAVFAQIKGAAIAAARASSQPS